MNSEKPVVPAHHTVDLSINLSLYSDDTLSVNRNSQQSHSSRQVHPQAWGNSAYAEPELRSPYGRSMFSPVAPLSYSSVMGNDVIIPPSATHSNEVKRNSNIRSSEPKRLSPAITSDNEAIQLINQARENPALIDYQSTFPKLKYFITLGFCQPKDIIERLSSETNINFFGINQDYMQEKIASCLVAFHAFPYKNEIIPQQLTKKELIIFIMSRIDHPDNQTESSIVTEEVFNLVRSLYLKYPVFDKYQMAEFILNVSPKLYPEYREQCKADLVAVIETVRKLCFPRMVLLSSKKLEGDYSVLFRPSLPG